MYKHCSVLNGRGQPCGQVTGGVFTRRIDDRQILQKPPALAYETVVIERARAMGAHTLRVIHGERVYTASMAHFLNHAFDLNRGFGPQKALGLNEWTIEGSEPPKVTGPAPTKERLAFQQLALWDGKQ